MKNLLIKHDACTPAREWAKGKTFAEAYAECPRGDWMLWLFDRTNPDDLQRLTLAKGHCANTVRHLMTDPRSLAAVDAAIAFGEGRISREELDAAASAASAAYAAAYAAYAAAAANANAASAAYAAASAAYAAARKENQRLTADICRKYLPIEIWNLT
jgi:hypothetical protein